MRFMIIILSLFILVCIAEENNSSAKISYSLLIWMSSLSDDGGLEIQIINVDVTAANNTNFYDVMKLAAEQNIFYKFEAKNYDFGHYITKIGEWEEIPSLKYHWMLYKLPTLPDAMTVPSDEFLTPKGVDETYIKDGEHYLFWYHQLHSLEH